VNPFFFGTSQRRLFGIHSPAASRAGKSRAAVLCQPWGDEYIYAHRPLRQLAVRLALAGLHTLRFDYFGTGDSAGEACDTNVAGMQADVLTAIETLKDLAATEKVSLIGLRAGANVAAGAAASSAGGIEALVLWDPILAGDPGGDSVPAELQPLDLDALSGRSLVLVTQRPPPHERSSRIELLPAPAPWTESVSTSGVIPLAVIQRIEEWLR
jgi:alpha-beta hydrolase superfamily lysophospholipase